MPHRIAIFGGTFDPVHNAHLEIARRAADRFSLDRVLFVPAKNPPHKLGEQHAPFEERFRMVELACACDPRFHASRIEDRPGRSYSFDTAKLVLEQNAPDTQVFFLIGADAFAEIESWHRWREFIELVDFIVVSRPGGTFATPVGARVHRLDDLALAVSSSEIRRKLQEGDGVVPVPDAVFDFIQDRHLYR